MARKEVPAGMQVTFDFYGDVKGRKFSSWITSGGRSTGYVAGNLIENPAYIIESILRDELALAAINIGSFDFVGHQTTGVRNDWRFARSVNRAAHSLEIIREIAYESCGVFLYDHANQCRLVAIDGYNPTLHLNNSHIVNENGRPLVRVRQTNVKYIYNEFFLNYRYNYGSGSYDKQLFITATDHNLSDNNRNEAAPLNTYTGLCNKSQQMYNVVRRWVYNANWIRSDATAEKFIKLMADWLAIRKWEVEATLWYTPDTLKLEAMDQVVWDLDLLPASVSGTSGFFVTNIVDRGIREGKLDMNFMLVPAIFFLGGGYGYNYGENYGIQL
jgi:hypothetical protein